LGVAGFVIAIVLFFIAVLITRWIFGIGKILNLLTVIAQELRARNAVDNVDARLDQMEMVVKIIAPDGGFAGVQAGVRPREQLGEGN
jgi:hypothetical protein